MYSFLDVAAAEDRCPQQGPSPGRLPAPAAVSTVTPYAELTTTQSDSSSLHTVRLQFTVSSYHALNRTFSLERSRRSRVTRAYLSAQCQEVTGGQRVGLATPPLPLSVTKRGPYLHSALSVTHRSF